MRKWYWKNLQFFRANLDLSFLRDKQNTGIASMFF